MKVGITYDLRSEYLKMGYSEEETAELDKVETIENIENALQNSGFETERIGHYHDLIKKLDEGRHWDLVYNIAEGMYGDGRESLVPSILDAYRVPYVFSSPATLAVSLNKYLTKRIVRDAGVTTPDFMVIYSAKEIDNDKPAFPLFLKPVSEGTGKGISNRSIVKNQEEFSKLCIELIDRFNQPVLVEEYLPGREFTVGLVGRGNDTRVLGAIEVCFREGILPVYSYDNKENWEGRVNYIPVTGMLLEECSKVATGAWNAIGAVDGGRVDVRVGKDGHVQFIEVNPLAGMNAAISDLPILARMNGIDYNSLIYEIMNAAIQRIFKKQWVKK